MKKQTYSRNSPACDARAGVSSSLWQAIGCFLLAGALAMFPVETAFAQERPNIVFILADDLGYGDLSSYGATDLQSPAIDKLVERGVRMDHFYANSPVCSPTRASIMSGTYPELAGVPGVIRAHNLANNWGYLNPAGRMLPQMLQTAGYHTALIGKWHLGVEPENHPKERGFDFFHGFLGDMMDDYYHHERAGNNYMRRNREVIDSAGPHATEMFTDWAIDYLNERAVEDEPFFLFMSHFAPHFPIQPPEAWFERVKQREPDIDERRARNVALIEHMDHEIGRLLDELRKLGLDENTLVVFTSDNGGSLPHGASNGNLRSGKQHVFEGGIRVPFVAVYPGVIPEGSSSDTVGITMDLFTTFCAVAGVEVEPDVDGVSLIPSLRGETQELDRNLFWTRREGGGAYMGLTIWAVRNGDWKLVKNDVTGEFMLFNLGDDPYETTDLSGSERPRFNEMGRLLRAHIQRGGAVPWQKRGN